MSTDTVAALFLGGLLIGGGGWLVWTLRGGGSRTPGRCCLGAWTLPVGPDHVLVVAGGAVTALVRLPPVPTAPPATATLEPTTGTILDQRPSAGADVADLEAMWSMPAAIDRPDPTRSRATTGAVARAEELSP